MVNRFFLATFAFVSMLPIATRAADNDQLESRGFSQCFLYRDAEGHIWVGEPLVSLGMIGVHAMPPVRVSPAVTQRLAPMVNEVVNEPKDHDLYWWGDLPKLRDQDRPVILLCLETKLRPSGKGEWDQPKLYEVVSADVVHAEFVSREWREAWKSLDAGLKEVIAASRTAPNDQKRQRLSQAIERSSRAINIMASVNVDSAHRALVRRIEPKARAVRLFQRNVERQWGGQLRECAARLRITPQTPLPPEPKDHPLLEMLIKSDSAATMLAEVKRTLPEDALEQRLTYSQSLQRMVFAWQVEHLTADQFHTLRRDAQKQLERMASDANVNQKPKWSRDEAKAIKEWSVVLRPADEKLLNEKLLLRGTLVDRVQESGSAIGLQRGDIIIDYAGAYDLVMGRFPSFSAMGRLTNMARYGGELLVLRGDKLITIVIKKP